MVASWLVQSAVTVSTPLARNSACTSSFSIATCSLTLQVTHQSAVKITNTGRPAATSASTRSGEYAGAAAALPGACAGVAAAPLMPAGSAQAAISAASATTALT